jgi:cell division FtsZ-interacting protein ZapD
VDRFLDHLDVARIPGTWFVQICYSDEDPTAAQAGVKAICRVSEDYHFGELVSAHDQMHIELLAEREQTFLDQRENLSKLLSNLSKQFVSPDLDSYQQEQIGWFNHLVEKEQESDLEDALSDLKAPTTVPTTRVDAVRARRQLFEEAILAQRTLLKNLDAQVEQFHELKAEIAADQQHIDSMRDQLEALDQRGLLISERVRFVSLPTLPTRPMPDSRRELAILGGVGAVQVIALFASIFAIARRQTRSWSAWVSLSASLILCACIVRLLLLGHMSHLFSTTSYGEVQLPPDPPDMRTPMPATPPQQFYR